MLGSHVGGADGNTSGLVAPTEAEWPTGGLSRCISNMGRDRVNARVSPDLMHVAGSVSLWWSDPKIFHLIILL